MNTDFLIDLENYFNVDLKKSLGYTETYTLSIHGNVIELIKHGGIPGRTLNFMIKDSAVKSQLESNITTFLKVMDPNVIYAELISDTGKIKFIVRVYPRKDVEVISSTLPDDIYLNLALKMDKDSIIRLSMVEKKFSTLYDNLMFWRNLFRIKFPNLYVITSKPYDWKKIYVETMDENDNLENIFSKYLLGKEHSIPFRLLEYLIGTNQVDDRYKPYLLNILTHTVKFDEVDILHSIIELNRNLSKDSYDETTKKLMEDSIDPFKAVILFAVLASIDKEYDDITSYLVNLPSNLNLLKDRFHIPNIALMLTTNYVRYLLRKDYLPKDVRENLRILHPE